MSQLSLRWDRKEHLDKQRERERALGGCPSPGNVQGTVNGQFWQKKGVGDQAEGIFREL